jgi:BlaI family transcriptional regulator, penicillinase repressor
MVRPPSRYPTELELEILKVLWEDGPSPVRHVRERLEPFRKRTDNSVMTIMGIMEEKGYLRRRQESSGYIYSAKVRRANTLGSMLSDLVDRAFSGSRLDAILELLDTSDLNAEDIARLRSEVNRKLKEQDS